MTSEQIRQLQIAAENDIPIERRAEYVATLEIALQIALLVEKQPPGVVGDGFHERMVFRGAKALRVACRCGWSADLPLGSQDDSISKAYEKHEYAVWVRYHASKAPA
jgi:hypothetical protein